MLNLIYCKQFQTLEDFTVIGIIGELVIIQCNGCYNISTIKGEWARD